MELLYTPKNNEKLLTREEEHRLLRDAQKGNNDSRDKLIFRNIKLVYNIASKYSCNNLSSEDIVQEGILGLLHAINLFNIETGNKFSTYATYWIKQSISRAIETKARIIRIPSHSLQLLRNYEKIRKTLLKESGKEPDLTEIASLMNISKGRLYELLAAHEDLLSFDLEIGDYENFTLSDTIADPKSNYFVEKIFEKDRRRCLSLIMKKLNVKEQAIIKLRLAYHEHPVSTARKIASRKLNLTIERIRQLEIQALKKMKHMMTNSKYDGVFLD